MSMIGYFVSREREKRGWTQLKLAKKAKVTTSFISAVENGKSGKHFSHQSTVRVLKALGVDFEGFLVEMMG